MIKFITIEDDPDECKAIKTEIDNYYDDFELIGITNTEERGYEYIINDMPDAIILDLESNQGHGNGIKIKYANLNYKPFVIITTNNISSITHHIARELGADFIFTKNQNGYSAKTIFDFLKTVESIIKQNQNKTIPIVSDSIAQKSRQINSFLNRELLKIQMSPKCKGFQYLMKPSH